MPTYIRVKQIDPDELSAYFNESIVSNSGVLYGYIASEAVSLTGDQTISGFKTFNSGTKFEKYIELKNLGDHANLSGLLVQVSGSGLRFFNKTGQKFFVDQIAGSGTGLNTLQLSNTNTTLKIPNNKNGYLAIDSELVHNTGQETISGQKTFRDPLYLSDLNVNDIDNLYISGVDIELHDLNISLDAASFNIPNLVYATGNQTISGVKTFANGSNQILNTTYSTLTGLKAISGLLSGQLYRISDFVLKWNNQSINDKTVKTAASGEPLIVTALSNKEISHLAQSETYPQDTIYYNINASGSYSWGTINNNLAIPNFKGWIYRRIDNLLDIDIPYDWRNITVNCCKPDVSSVPNYSGNYQYSKLNYVKETGNNSNRGKLYYSVVTGNSGNALSNANFWSPVSDYVESGTYFATREDVNFTALYAYDNFADEDIPIINLPFISNSRIQQPVFTSTFTGLGVFKLSNVYNIKINGGCNSVFLGDSVYNNNIGDNFYSNTIGQNTYSNDIGDNFYHNILSNGNAFNDIGDNCFRNIAMGNFSYNKINHEFFYNTIANNFYSNNIKSYFIINIIGANFQYNKIDQYFSKNLTASTFYYNNIGINFDTNTIGNTFYYNTIGNIFRNNTIGNNFVSNTSEGNINGIDFTSSTHVYSGYNTILFKNAALSQRLRYFNSSDQLVVTDPTA